MNLFSAMVTTMTTNVPPRISLVTIWITVMATGTALIRPGNAFVIATGLVLIAARESMHWQTMQTVSGTSREHSTPTLHSKRPYIIMRLLSWLWPRITSRCPSISIKVQSINCRVAIETTSQTNLTTISLSKTIPRLSSLQTWSSPCPSFRLWSLLMALTSITTKPCPQTSTFNSRSRAIRQSPLGPLIHRRFNRGRLS